jgi:hypothetical protein
MELKFRKYVNDGVNIIHDQAHLTKITRKEHLKGKKLLQICNRFYSNKRRMAKAI